MQERIGTLSEGSLLRIRLKARRAAIFGENDNTDVFQRLCGTLDMKESLRNLRYMIILDSLERNGYRVCDTAKELHIDRMSIFRTCRALGISQRSEKHKCTINKRFTKKYLNTKD